MGESTHRPAKATTSLARRGTLGSLRRRRTVVAHAGSTVARSFAVPGGRRRASTIMAPQDAMSSATATTRSRIMAGAAKMAVTVAEGYDGRTRSEEQTPG